MPPQGANLSTKVLAGALLSDADLSKSNLQEGGVRQLAPRCGVVGTPLVP